MAVISRTSFSTGDLLTAAQWNTQFDTAYNVINGSLDSTNLASGAVASANIASNAVRGSHILTATITAGHTAGIVSLGGLWGFEYQSIGSAATAQNAIQLEPGSIEIQGIRYYLSSTITATPTGLAASASYYLYWQAPSSGYGLSATSDLVISNSAPSKISSATAQGLYNGTTQRCFGFFRTRHTGATLFPIVKTLSHTKFANNVTISTNAITPTAANFAITGADAFLKSVTIFYGGIASSGNVLLYSAMTSTSTDTDLILLKMNTATHTTVYADIPIYASSIRLRTDANNGTTSEFFWTGFPNPW